MIVVHLDSGGVTVKGVGFSGSEGGGGIGLLDRGRATASGGVVEFAPVSLPELTGGGDEAEVEEGVVEAGIRAAEEAARKEWGGIVDKAPMDTAGPVEGKGGAPKGLCGGGGGC